MSCGYYYPFGTQNNLLLHEFQNLDTKRNIHHALFHFDQEPLWQHDLGQLYEKQEYAWTTRYLKILANSERSALKSKVLRDRSMADWYFFYHGFAALDWFRDTRYINTDKPVDHAFLSFNHVLKPPRYYRIDLAARLGERGLLTRGRISLHCHSADIKQAVDSADHAFTESSRRRILTWLAKDDSLPWYIDRIPINGDLSARLGNQEFGIWQSALLHVVNETVFYDLKLHLTEKVFKTIVAKRPFVLVAAPGNLAYLRSYGFQTFDQWIDESYDEIEDPDLRLEAIVEQIDRISRLNRNQLCDLQQDMKSVLDHNKQHFFTDFRRKIVDELVDNFETCIRVWNNGRIDGQEIAFTIDTDQVKTILLQ